MANTVNKVLTIAEVEVGYLEKSSTTNLDSKENGASDGNYTKYWRDLKPSFQGQPWCQGFVNWIFVQAYGIENAKKLLCTKTEWSYYTPTCAQYFKNNKQWCSKPKVGDVIYFKNSTRICHVGIVYKVDSKYVYTIEGNTSSTNDTVIANGGGVFKKQYALTNSRIAGYGRPKYDELEDDSNYSSTIDDNLVTCPIKTGQKRLSVSVEGSLNVRDYPVTGKEVGVLYNGNVVTPTMKTVAENGKTWFYLSDRNGWVSASYLTGWIQEEHGEWWWLDKGYTWPSSCVKKIDGALYYFNCDGYLIRNNIIHASDDITYFSRFDGSLITDDWYEYAGSWYYCGEDGAALKKKFALFEDKNKQELYWFNENGVMYKGRLTLETNNRGALEIVKS